MKTTLIVIEDDADHAAAKALAARLIQSDRPEDIARFAAQAQLIEAWEKKRWPRRTPQPAEVLRYLMEQHGLSRIDLARILGTESRVSEALNGKRPLSMSMVRRLRERFGVSADVLIPQEARTA